jgi:hypothetical protein
MARTLKPLAYARRRRLVRDLKRGFHGKHVDFDWRPYKLRDKRARARFDALVVSIFHNGILDPLITHGDHVLIGQQRHEIAERLGIVEVETLDVIEDVSEWGELDIKRLEKLRDEVMWAKHGRR